MAVPNKADRIISDEQFELAQQLRATNKRFALGSRKHSYLLTHRIRSLRSAMSAQSHTSNGVFVSLLR